MAQERKVYVAGVGLTPSPSGSSFAKAVIAAQVSACTKALLDAGVTYDDVAHGVASEASSQGLKAFKTIDEEITVNEVAAGSELDTSVRLVKDLGVQCVLAVATEKSVVVALVLVSENFLWRHSYLKDSSALIRMTDTAHQKSGGPALSDICQRVWELRGWAPSDDRPGEMSPGFELSRADSNPIPKWEEVKHKQDGKHRLGYNPAAETKDIFWEDFEAVRAVGRTNPQSNNWVQFKRRGGDRASLAKL